ncbi:hypothetical protein CCO03_07105 [Comamonas serinivorans]|uniref:G domain-containing protein n=2 Tax=Comamonas serinivorans TaxID=1082851 RepID=A0A1Y0ESZ2_9BURK|nr:hypothetical protein CCO03_07105 [Comamonas serinivorans]
MDETAGAMVALDTWLARLTQGLAANRLQPPGLHRDGELARQVQALNAWIDRQAQAWALQWDELAPAYDLSRRFDGAAMLLVFGKFNAGKSSLCNFLADRFAAQGRAVRYVHLEGGRLVETGQRLQEGATETTARLQGVCLGDRLVLLDTPGLHSTTPENAALTQRFIDSADGVLWLTSSTSPGQVQALDELARELHRGKPLLPVITRSDTLEEDEVDGEIRKCLCNKSPANRALQEADVLARAQDKLRQLGVDPQLLCAPVSVSAHVAREQAQTPAALEAAGFDRLYAALLALMRPAQAYKRRKPAEVRLHHLDEQVLGAVRTEGLPALAQLDAAVCGVRDQLAASRSRMLRAAWRQVAPALPALLAESPVAWADLAGWMQAAVREQAAQALAEFEWPGNAAGWPDGEACEAVATRLQVAVAGHTALAELDPQRWHDAVQAAVQHELTAAFDALATHGEARLDQLSQQVHGLRSVLDCEDALQDIGRALRAPV